MSTYKWNIFYSKILPAKIPCPTPPPRAHPVRLSKRIWLQALSLFQMYEIGPIFHIVKLCFYFSEAFQSVPECKRGLQHKNKQRIIEFDKKLAELREGFGKNLLLQRVFAVILDHRTFKKCQKLSFFLLFGSLGCLVNEIVWSVLEIIRFH